jgi:hypothetical protein
LHCCGGIAAYSLEDVSPVWWLHIMTNRVGTPIIFDDVIYVSTCIEMSEAERRGKFFTYDIFEKLLEDFDPVVLNLNVLML